MEYAEPWESRIGVPESFVPDRFEEVPSKLPGGASYELLTTTLRDFLDNFAGGLLAESDAQELAATLDLWAERLAGAAVPERDQAFGHRVDLHGRGQVMAPAFVMTDRAEDRVTGTVRFGRYFLGGNGAVHGGAIALLFDEVLGRLSDTGARPPARTASLSVNYRAITPIETDLVVEAWFEEEVDRKRHVVGEIRNGNVVCAEARGLFIGLAAHQN